MMPYPAGQNNAPTQRFEEPGAQIMLAVGCVTWLMLIALVAGGCWIIRIVAHAL